MTTSTGVSLAYSGRVFAYLDEWVEWLRASGRTTETIRVRISQISVASRRVADPLTVTTRDLVAVLSDPTWAPETRKGIRSALVSYFDFLEIVELRADNPARKLPKVSIPSALPRPASEAALAAALTSADADVRLMILLAAYAGLRRAEIAGLHTDDVGDDGLRIVGKGGKHRVVPLAPFLREALEALPTGWVFPSPVLIGEPLTADNVGRKVTAALPGKWTTHTLRHRFATRAYQGSHDLRAVQELLGHSSVVTTQRYTMVSSDARMAAVMAAL